MVESKATLVLPCRNEALWLAPLLSECRIALDNDSSTTWEILLVDNGSSDGSVEIARQFGLRVILEDRPGYGRALDRGIREAKTDWVVFFDADGTYCPVDAIRLAHHARMSDLDLLIGSRFKGRIHPGAMPWPHRYLGTPALSFLLRTMHRVPVTDCNSGIRCLKKSSYLRWGLESAGMEFASEILVKAARNGSRIGELPVSLRAASSGRRSHLRPISDGLRHLAVIMG